MKKIFLLLLLNANIGFGQDLTKQLKEFDTYVENARKEWQVPGLAVAVVKDGKIIFKKGYGVREIGTTNLVDTQTIFGCGSTTKAMTAVCMGLLVDEGKVNWNDPVAKYLPDFKLYDVHATRELKIRDLFIHNSGVGNADFLWSVMDISSEEILKKMELVEPSYSLRSSFIYQNIFYVVAGKVIEKVSGQKWEQFIVERIFKPLKMNRTFSQLANVKEVNQSKPHYFYNNAIRAITPTSADKVGAAGSIYSCIDDISLWMQSMIDSSKYAGGRLLKPNTWAEMFRPQTIVPASQFYPTMQLIKPNWTTYGLGWFQHDYKGKKINYHTGSLAGEVAIHAQLPDAKLGVYFFGNYDHAEVRHALVYKTFDLFALGGNRDWSKEFLKLYGDLKAQGEKAEKDFEAKRVANTKLSLPLSSYEGKYTDKLYGEAEVRIVDGSLKITTNNFLTATVQHWHFDVFRGDYEKGWYGKAVALFSLNATGEIEKLNFEGMEFVKEKAR
jgi:CubicO group peptidase (beta-lactamase class C family)